MLRCEEGGRTEMESSRESLGKLKKQVTVKGIKKQHAEQERRLNGSSCRKILKKKAEI